MTTLPSPLAEQVRIDRTRPAVITPDTSLSYEELRSRTYACEHELRARGIGEGTRLGILMDNSLELFILLHTCFESGIIAAPISTRMPGERVEEHLELVGADTVITDDANRLPDQPGFTVLTADNLPNQNDAAPEESSRIDLDRFATIVFTSGSTGTPKAALHTYGNHYFSAAGSGKNISLTARSRWLLSLPLYHVGGIAILFRCLLAGAAVVIPKHSSSPADAISAYDITHASMVSTQLRRLLKSGIPAVDQLEALLLGGGAIPDGLIDEAFDRGLPIHVSYGLTEMSSQVTTTPPKADRQQLHASGRLLPFRELAISPGGEILVRGPTLFAGYIRRSGLERPVDEAGWFHTGDVGTLDEEEFLHVRGRVDNMFISGGENIQPETIETALEQLHSIQQAIVVPVSDEEFGHRPVAFVRWQKNPRSLNDVYSALADSLERFKRPIALYPMPEEASHPEEMKISRERLIQRAEASRQS